MRRRPQAILRAPAESRKPTPEYSNQLGIDLAALLVLGFILSFPEEIFLNVTGEEGEENPHHQGVVDQTNSRQSLWDQVEGVDEVEKAEKTAQQGAGGPLSIAAEKEIAEHGGGGADQAGKLGEFGAGAERIHGPSTMLNHRPGNEEFGGD